MHRHQGDRHYSLLILTTTFPPLGGSSVQRVAKLAKYAHQNEHHPIILTTDYNGPFSDQTLTKDLPEDLEVHRIRDGFSNSHRIVKHLARLQYPDEFQNWSKKAVAYGVKIASKKNIDAIFVSFGSPSALFAGVTLSKKLDLPLILDIRDLWTHTYLINRRNRPGTLLGRIDKFMEARAWRHVDHFTVVSEGYKKTLQKTYGVPSEKITVIFNGFDPEDLKTLPAQGSCEKQKGPIIRFPGFVTETRGLGLLIQAISGLNEKRIARNAPPVFLELMGGTPDKLIEQALQGKSRPEWFKTFGYHTHSEALLFMRKADILALFQPPGEGMLTGKLFEYIGVQRPILHLDNRTDELKRIVEENGFGISVPQENIMGIASAIERLLDWDDKNEHKIPALFRRDYQAGIFMDVVHNAVSAHRNQQ